MSSNLGQALLIPARGIVSSGGNVIASDNFTDASGTLIENHVPSGGGSWALHPLFSAVSVISNANRVRASSSGVSTPRLVYHSAEPATSDYTVEADFVVVGDNNMAASIAGRISTSADTCYLAGHTLNTNVWYLTKRVAGVTTVMDSHAATLNIGQTYRVQLIMNGTMLTLTVDGDEVLQVIDSDITTAGRAGFHFGGSQSDSTGIHLDNWSLVE